MIYLFDVNALIAFGFRHHAFHTRVSQWIRAERSVEIATCSITELGFVRVLAQAHTYGQTAKQARLLLEEVKRGTKPPFVHISDDHGAAQLPEWVNSPKHITDGHLLQLAAARGFALATLDQRIPGAFVIPG